MTIISFFLSPVRPVRVSGFGVTDNPILAQQQQPTRSQFHHHINNIFVHSFSALAATVCVLNFFGVMKLTI